MPTVFIGEVETVQEIGDQFQHRLRVVRPLKGLTAQTAEVWSDATTSCGLKLSVGERYVIYTSASTGRMSIHACQPIVHLAPGEPEPELPPVPGRVYGRVVRYDLESIRRSEGLDPIPSVRLWLDLPSGRVASLSDAWGRFSFSDVPPGRYDLGVDAGQGLTPWMARPVVMTASGACVDSHVVLHPSGALTGPLVTADGQPAPGVYVLLIDPDGEGPVVPGLKTGRSSKADGRITFDGLASGDYILAVNPGGTAAGNQPYATTWYGGRDRASATRIRVGAGQPTELPTPFVLPPKLPTRTFTVAVTCRDGSVPPYVSAVARSVADPPIEEWALSKDGVETVTLLRDRAYTMKITASIPYAADDPHPTSRRGEALPAIEIPAGTAGRHIALIAPFAGCAERP
jgi:hypothetical protein